MMLIEEDVFERVRTVVTAVQRNPIAGRGKLARVTKDSKFAVNHAICGLGKKVAKVHQQLLGMRIDSWTSGNIGQKR
jgi:hypothetical protein